MRALVVGASGATGQKLVRELLNRNVSVNIIVREKDKLPNDIKTHGHLTIKEASILQLSEPEMLEMVKDCDAVASCLGHNITIKGIFGKPKMLVTDSVQRLCHAIQKNNTAKSVKFVLMNTTANTNKDLNEPLAMREKFVFSVLRNFLPPQLDNERAADYLRTEIGKSNTILEWSIVRPDTLIDENTVTEYKVFPSPVRSPIFDAGKTSRINVAHFLADLMTNENVWLQWKGKMPVIYNEAYSLRK